MAERVEHYDFVSNIAQASTAISLGQLLRRNAREAAAMARKIL